MDCLDETTLALFLEHRLPGEQVRGMQHHIDTCDACRQVVAALGRSTPTLADGSAQPTTRTPRPIQRGDRIGRYVVLDRVGSGAMGAVYAAFDPDLDRKVAVKLLHGVYAEDERDRTRMLREAQALARVSHPGVVAVHDVGTHEDQVFIAMEFVAGGTLRTWLSAARRSWREVLEVVLPAARGLAAAHAAGVVHRDVKPDNILVDRHGTARIGDFGLAAGLGDAPKRPSDPLLEAASLFDAELTAPGAIVGTPAYMAPEQLAGSVVTARSDQFSLCATLYESLYGVRAYAGKNLRELKAAIMSRTLSPPPANRRVPSRVHAAVVRGLAIDPAARHASIEALIAALSRDPWSRRRVAVLAGVGAATAFGGLALALSSSPQAQPPCTTAEAELAPAWNPERKAEVRRALLATGLPFATDSAGRIELLLDGYARSWIAMHTETCKATAVHRTQSAELLDRRMSCLGARRIALDTVATTLAASTREDARFAPRIAEGLPPLTACADVDALGRIVAPPQDPAARATLAQIDRDVEQARALIHTASPARAAELARSAVTRAEHLGYAPALASAHYTHGRTLTVAGDPAGARASFERAVLAAVEGGDGKIEARAIGQLAQRLSESSADGQVAIDRARHGLALAKRTHDPLLEAELHYANIVVLAGVDIKALVEHFARARAQLAAAAAAGVPVFALQLELELIDAKLELMPAASYAKLRTALATAERAYGPQHPLAAAVHVEMANFAVHFDEALAREHARLASELFGPYEGNEVEIGRIEARLEDDPAKRLPILEEVVRDSEKLYGPRSRELAMDREALADTLHTLGKYREGLVHVDQAIATWEAAFGGQHEMMIAALVTKAQLLSGLEDWDGAAAAAERAGAIVDRGGMREVTKVTAKLLLVDTYFRQRRFARCVATLEEVAPSIKLMLLGDEQVTAILDFYDAAARWELGRDRPAQLARARAQYKVLLATEAPPAESVEFMKTWLAGK